MAEETRGDRLERELGALRETVESMASATGRGLEALRERAQEADNVIRALKVELGARSVVDDAIYGERVERTYAPDAELEMRYPPDGYTIWDLNKEDGTYGKDHVPSLPPPGLRHSTFAEIAHTIPDPVPMEALETPTMPTGLVSKEPIRIRVFAWTGTHKEFVDAIKRTYEDGRVRVCLADFDNGRDFLLSYEYEELS